MHRTALPKFAHDTIVRHASEMPDGLVNVTEAVYQAFADEGLRLARTIRKKVDHWYRFCIAPVAAATGVEACKVVAGRARTPMMRMTPATIKRFFRFLLTEEWDDTYEGEGGMTTTTVSPPDDRLGDNELDEAYTGARGIGSLVEAAGTLGNRVQLFPSGTVERLEVVDGMADEHIVAALRYLADHPSASSSEFSVYFDRTFPTLNGQSAIEFYNGLSMRTIVPIGAHDLMVENVGLVPAKLDEVVRMIQMANITGWNGRDSAYVKDWYRYCINPSLGTGDWSSNCHSTGDGTGVIISVNQRGRMYARALSDYLGDPVRLERIAQGHTPMFLKRSAFLSADPPVVGNRPLLVYLKAQSSVDAAWARDPVSTSGPPTTAVAVALPWTAQQQPPTPIPGLPTGDGAGFHGSNSEDGTDRDTSESPRVADGDALAVEDQQAIMELLRINPLVPVGKLVEWFSHLNKFDVIHLRDKLLETTIVPAWLHDHLVESAVTFRHKFEENLDVVGRMYSVRHGTIPSNLGRVVRDWLEYCVEPLRRNHAVRIPPCKVEHRGYETFYRLSWKQTRRMIADRLATLA